MSHQKDIIFKTNSSPATVRNFHYKLNEEYVANCNWQPYITRERWLPRVPQTICCFGMLPHKIGLMLQFSIFLWSIGW